MPHAAVLGSPIAHSLSPLLHNAGYAALGLDDWTYTAIECTAVQLPTLIDPSFAGYSVTMPCKFAALDAATEVTDRAREIGSANTLVRRGNGWLADNTDCLGVLGALEELDVAPRTAVVIGAGGTARAVLWALRELGVSDVTVMNRSDRTKELAGLADAQWLPLGTIPDADVVVSTLPGAAAAELSIDAPLFDVSYSPWPPPLIAQAASKNLPHVAGHVMLAHQAYAQFELFTGQPAPRDAMRSALEARLFPAREEA
ncbi:shikimate dehydrogenase [Corynebacterium hindlerae]|uniref:shikimate dehydrogenase n=1 Tax=Corynebacterium hindlerae TaxID=699041 RepID=UPI001AD7089B|nr:shikimate dehydrogenase [Corynebacterium hindlerae]QTH58720.1 shikimate dehydrogenase [Corynebacterium hindlerae]